MTKTIFDNDGVTANSAQLDILKKNFPNCFDKEGSFLIEKFKEILGANELLISRESYGLNWLGKSYARLLANEKPRTLIKPNHEHNQKEQNQDSRNLLIKGDNLEVLKHLKNAYSEKVKMIYIDPPYNTGSDGFVYQDDRQFTKEELSNLANISLEEAEHILEFTSKKSNSHSAWLTFMYPRLYIARELLREDGVIFISIDDNEQAQLKILCDEIFGEENFIANIASIMNLKGNPDSFGFADTHEYALVYAKKRVSCTLNEFVCSEEELEDWSEDSFGLFKRADTLRRTGQDASRESRPKGWFPIFIDSDDLVYVTDNDKPKNPDDLKLWPVNSNNEELSWTWSKHKITNEPHNLIVIDGRNGKNIYKKQRPSLGDLPTSKPKTHFYKPEYSTSTATIKLKDIFNKRIFDGPKPLPYIKDFIIIGSEEKDIILDFFAGSGTTAHAVLELNKELGSARTFISVQLPELTKETSTAYKNGYKTIFDITKARIEKAAAKIQEENPDYKGDLGFKIFETMPLPKVYDFEADKLTPETMDLFEGAKLNDEELEALLVTWSLYDRIPLTANLETIKLAEYPAIYAKETLYLMHPGFNLDATKALLEKLDNDDQFVPKKIVIYGHNFESREQRELHEAVNSYRNRKEVDIDLVKRY